MSFIKIENNNTVILNKFTGSFQVSSYASEEWKNNNFEHLRTALVIDLETTGLDYNKDKVIEIGLRSFKFDRRNGDIVEVSQPYTALEDPQQPLSQTILDLTGLRDEDLKDKSIDWSVVTDAIEKAHVIIAHNAEFERAFIDPKIPASNTKIWACSLSQVNWNTKGFKSQKLEVLSYYHGFFLDFHRAMNDVDALIHLLSFKDKATSRTYLNELLENAKQPCVKILAQGAPFEAKDLLKNNGYKWNKKCWWKAPPLKESEAEIKWLEENVYLGPFRGTIQELRLIDQFKTELS